ncbi:Gluconeogenesis factor [bioreactor metagenome]|uniref:Gluconeogenesis factor n=1 Tax=bioreactor metagenome TaxID=1076179 RepID=A0A645CYM8_9ZZZZ
MVNGVAEAIAKSPAISLYVVNVMCQPGETDHLTASQHVAILNEYLSKGSLDYAFVNSGDVAVEWLERYSQSGGEAVQNDSALIQKMGVKVVENDYVKYQNYVRHNEERLAKDIIELILAEKLTLQQRRDLVDSLQKEKQLS